MGILGNVTDGVTGSIDNILSTIKNPFGDKNPPRFAPDFSEGFIIQEYIDGRKAEKIVLQGNMLPKVPFSFGGEQKIVKDYYPGNSEPVTQVLGARESDTIVKGLLKSKQFVSDGTKTGLYGAPEAFQRQLDAFRIRGNLCRFSLGEWHRYGYLAKTHFEMHQLSRIEYELTLDIVGFNPPENGKFVDRTKELPFAINKTLIAQVATIKTTPTTFPKSISGVMNGYISDIGKAMGLVTNFVDTTLKTAEDVTGSLNRALGLVKNARASISIFQRRVGALSLSIPNLGITTPDNTKTATQIKAQQHNTAALNTWYILTSLSNTRLISNLLAQMQSQFETLIETLPQARYLVKTGDTLQQIAIKYFADADQWKLIYDRNHLTSTQLTVGTILEIPKRPANSTPTQKGGWG